MKKEDLLHTLRNARKRYGKDSPKTYKAIYNLVRKYPYYPSYERDWLHNNGHNLK